LSVTSSYEKNGKTRDVYIFKSKQTKWPAIPLGTRVRRGPSWSWKNQDSNMAGTVIGEDTTGKIVLFLSVFN
jgi:hypothetical protein